jgi:hypothetical protein
VETLRSKIAALASKNRSLIMLWRKILPFKIRFYILQRFSLFSSGFSKYNETLIGMLEEPGAYNFDKKEQVIKFLKKNKFGVISPEFSEIWLEKDSIHGHVFNFNGAYLPCTEDIEEGTIAYTFPDTFLLSLLFNDDYSAARIERLDKVMMEGPYGYTADGFDVTVKQGDTVIDAGAWIGDFSAYAAAKGAVSYAFEPFANIFKTLRNTAELNRGGGGDSPCKRRP